LVIVVDSISFQLPITQLPISALGWLKAGWDVDRMAVLELVVVGGAHFGEIEVAY